MTVDNFDTESQAETPEIEYSKEEAALPDDEMQKPVFNKIQMSDAIKRERAKAFEKAKKEVLMQLKQQNELGGMPSDSGMQSNQNSLGGMPQGLTAEQVRQLIAEQAPEVLSNHVNSIKNEHIVNSFVSKMQAAEKMYPGLEQKLSKLNYSNPAMIKLVQMANELENTGDIMHELLSNPMKMGNVLNLAKEEPFIAGEALRELSNSIKTNQKALSESEESPSPLSQIKPSNVGMGNGKAMSVSDFRKMFRG